MGEETLRSVTIRCVTMTPPWPAPSTIRPRRWPVVILAVWLVMNIALSTAALVVALTRPTSTSYTAAQRARAKAHLCDRYRLASSAVHIETNSSDTALARIAVTNGAFVLKTAAAFPALDAIYRDAALALAVSYENLTAKSTNRAPGDPEIQAVIDDSNAKRVAMNELCGE